MEMEFSGKRILLVDDSIVRGTTSREIVQMAREKGAMKVYFASCAPAIRYPHIHGIDLADTRELVAHGRTPEQVAVEIGADMVIYQKLEDLKKCVSGFNKDIHRFRGRCVYRTICHWMSSTLLGASRETKRCACPDKTVGEEEDIGSFIAQWNRRTRQCEFG